MAHHGEAFKIMEYRCEACAFGEFIWNSRDGVTPFCVDCRRCGKTAQHVNWRGDRYAPDHDPAPGDRYFRDGIAAEARAIVRRRLEMGRDTDYEVPEEEWPEWVARISESHEFQAGWPMLVVRGTDADTLAARPR